MPSTCDHSSFPSNAICPCICGTEEGGMVFQPQVLGFSGALLLNSC